VPYLEDNIIDNKKFTLVLDLDEKLINFRREDAQKGILRFRPGLHKFLNEVKQVYKVIVFIGSQEYTYPILNTIKKQEKFFDTRLHRQHDIVMDNVFVKDLSRLGRDISKVIIVDNMPYNF
jgi:CTD small phosphatase-like protein 2